MLPAGRCAGPPAHLSLPLAFSSSRRAADLAQRELCKVLAAQARVPVPVRGRPLKHQLVVRQRPVRQPCADERDNAHGEAPLREAREAPDRLLQLTAERDGRREEDVRRSVQVETLRRADKSKWVDGA